MSYIQRLAVPVVTAANGSTTAYSAVVSGNLSQIRYVKDTFDNGVGFTITNETTGETLWTEASVNASATRAPRQPAHSTVGAALGATIVDKVALANDRVKIVIASGGDAKSGTFHIVLE